MAIHSVYRNVLFEFMEPICIWASLGFFISNLAKTDVHPGDFEKQITLSSVDWCFSG